MATQQEERRRLRRNSGRPGGSNTPARNQGGRGARIRQAANNAASRAAEAGRGAANRLRGASPRRSPGTSGLADGGAPASGGSGRGVRRGLRIGGRVLGTTGAVIGGAAAAGPALREGVGNMDGVTDLEGFSEGALDTELGRVADSAAQTVAQATTGDPNVGRRGMTVVDGGTTSLNTDLRRGERRPENMRTDPQGRGPRGVIDREGRRFEITTMDARTAEGEEEEAGTVANGSGRLRLQRERPRTFGREGTTIDAARADEPEAAQLQGEVMAPGLPGVPESEQEVTRVTDGQGGVGVVRSRAGLRQGGGTFSTMDNAAAAAVPVDNAGVSRALQAAAERGDWDAVEQYYADQGKTFNGVTPNERRRERLRREIRQTRGLDQSFSSMFAEGARRRAARDELEAMDTARLRRQDNAAAMQRTLAGRQPTALELAEAQQASAQEQRENERKNRESTLETMNSRFVDSEGEPRADAIDQYMGILERSEVDHSKPAQVRSAIDTIELADYLDTVAADTSGLFGTSILGDDREPTMETIQTSLGEIAAGLGGQYDDWGGDATIPWRGGVVRLEDLSEDMKQRLFNFRDRMTPNARTGSQ